MYYYFHVQFTDPNADIYIVRVLYFRKPDLKIGRGHVIKITAMRMIMNELHGISEDDFEIQIITLPKSILSRLVFIRNIAQLAIVIHP